MLTRPRTIDDRRERALFVVTWVFLVVVVACGFWIQARTLDRLERDEQIITEHIAEQERVLVHEHEVLCGLLVTIDPEDRVTIAKAFASLGYRCDTGATALP